MSRFVGKFVVLAVAALAAMIVNSKTLRGEEESKATASQAAPAAPVVDPKCDGGCGCSSVCDPESFCHRHIIATAEAVWLAPLNNQRVGTYEILDGDNKPISQYSAASATSDGLVATPRIMLGIQGECWGAQLRYWRMDESQTVNHLDPVVGTGLFAQSNFKAETIDLELTRLLCIGESQAQFSVGLRYAQLEQSAGLSANKILNYGINDNDFYSGSVLSGARFSGTGITSALTGLRPIGCGNFNLFYSLRASLLWDGNASNFVQTRADYQNTTGPNWSKAYNAAYANGASDMFIGELQIGGQWNYALECIPANAFIRVAFEYQYWATKNMGDARAFSFAGALDGPVGVATGRSGDVFVNLVGFNVGTGITW
ncbi:MAG: hypothetical protein WCJ35_19910 [Planctomycetota bacterium]